MIVTCPSFDVIANEGASEASRSPAGSNNKSSAAVAAVNAKPEFMKR
jgi:hypothetical protein